MRTFIYKKLVRDKILELMTSRGSTANWRILSEDEYIDALKKKLAEESVELPQSEGEDFIKELADIQEIVDALLEASHVSKDQFDQIQKKKRETNGGFTNRYYIETVEEPDDSKWIDYYLKDPDKFPEVK